ncbi:unnamed protein product [Tetraodon nigroviridis]|uniref:(spotted green pufferfish) hypothetical protein n=1 Tax=Tetraodon nigroviridis TaxID=99883 RepID=Q4T4H0_TETNG|nr:unnamed protein product [Tetraodon nigroviridis]
MTQPEEFVQDSGAKLNVFEQSNRVLSPIKRETFCVQDSPLKQLPPAIQQRLLRSSINTNSSSARRASTNPKSIVQPASVASLLGKRNPAPPIKAKKATPLKRAEGTPTKRALEKSGSVPATSTTLPQGRLKTQAKPEALVPPALSAGVRGLNHGDSAPVGSASSDSAASGEASHRPDQHPQPDPNQQQVLRGASGRPPPPLPVSAGLQPDKQNIFSPLFLQLIDLSSPLIKWSPENKSENVAPLINLSF